MAKKTLEQVRVKAFIRQVQSNESALGAIITYLACISILFAVYFFPVYLIPFIALIPAILAYKAHPGIGLVATWLLALPAFAFQSSVFAWVGSLFLIVVLYTAEKHWATISLATIAVFLPFAPFPLSLLGGFIYLVLLVGAMYLGSKESIPFTATTVLLILLISATWNVPNSAHFPLNPATNFESHEDLVRATDIPFYPADFLPAYSDAISNIFNIRAAMNFGNVLGVLWNNLMLICFSDTGLLQAVTWMTVIWSAAFFTGRPLVRLPMLFRKIEVSFLFLLAIPIIYAAFYALDNVKYMVEMPVYAIASILVAQWMMNNKIMTFRELEIRGHETERSFGTTAVQEMSLSTDVESLEDFANYEETKKEIYNSIVIPLKKPEISIAYNINPPKGILLFGPPGTGKTFLMKALSKKLEFDMIYVKTSELLSSLYGESEKNVSKIFENAKKKAPCILFFDEIDAIGKKRSSEDYVTSRVLDTMLVEMDNIMSRPGKPVIFIAATNVPQLIDKALIRPGRIDKIIYMPLPDTKGREAIFKVKLKGLPVSDDINIAKLAEETERFSGADVALVVQEAKGSVVEKLTQGFDENQSARGEITPITMDDLLSAAQGIKPSTSLADIELYEKFKYDFERKRKKETKKEEGAIGFKDVVGMDDMKEALRQSLELPIKHPELIKEYKIELSKGILLFGPPGTGKTYVARAAAGEFNIPILLASGADLMKKGHAAAAEELKVIFNRARENPPAIVFIDELETVAPLRSGSELVVGQLLQEMDGLAKNKNIMIIGATNMPHMIDTALLRPGRFDKIIYIGPQEPEARKDLFRMYLAPFGKGVDFDALAQGSAGFSAADIKSICSEAKIDAAKHKIRGGGEPSITTKDVMAKLLSRRPSITQQMLREFQRFMEEYGERK